VVADNVSMTTEAVTAMKPALPAGMEQSIATVRDDLSGLFESLDTSLTDIQDAASAQRAMPALRQLNTKIDSVNQLVSRLPEASRTLLRPTLEEQVKVATEKANAASSIDGIGSEIKALIHEIVTKISKWISADNR
jgi:hypothetical protein